MKKVGRAFKTAAPLYVAALPEHHRQTATDVLNGVYRTVDVFNDEQAASAVDQTVTPQGRALRAERAAATALAELAAVETETQKLTTRAEAIKKVMLAKVVSVAPKDAATESQMREIREQLRQLPADQRLAIYRSSHDPLVIAAIETAPLTLSASRRQLEPFVDPAELASAQMARAVAADPKGAQTLAELTQLAEVYRLAVNGVRGEILAAPVSA